MQPGYFVTILNWNTPPTQPQRISTDENSRFLRILSSLPWQDGGVAGLKNVTIGECGIGTLPSFNCPTTPWNPTGSAESNAFQTIIQGTQFGTYTTPPPPRYRGH